MIEGLKVTVGGIELAALCIKRAEHHEARAKQYAETLENMQRAEIEAAPYTNGDPKRTVKEKQEQHENEAAEMRFIATHLIPSEQYQLDGNALYKLGISKRSGSW